MKKNIKKYIHKTLGWEAELEEWRIICKYKTNDSKDFILAHKSLILENNQWILIKQDKPTVNKHTNDHTNF